MGRSKEALVCYDRALEIDPENLGVRCLKGFAFNNLKEFEKSIECYDEVLKLNPDDVFSWYQKGSALESLGRYTGKPWSVMTKLLRSIRLMLLSERKR